MYRSVWRMWTNKIINKVKHKRRLKEQTNKLKPLETIEETNKSIEATRDDLGNTQTNLSHLTNNDIMCMFFNVWNVRSKNIPTS